MIIRSYSNGFELQDWTEELLVVPNTWGLIQQLGIFNDIVPISQNTVTFEESNKTFSIITDKVRGERNNVGKMDGRKVRAYPVPHFPLDDALFATELQGKRAYGSDAQPDSKAIARTKKLERIRMSHAATLEFARAQMLTSGTVYAPNGTIGSINLYTDFGVTRKEVDFVLGTAGTEIADKIEEVIAHIQDNLLSGEVATDIVALCSSGFFSKLIRHAKVSTAYQYYTTTGAAQPLRERLNAPGLSGQYRSFDFHGILFIEYRGSYTLADGTVSNLITAGEAFAFPMGTQDTFKTYFGPAGKFDLVNTLGEEAYFFEYPDQKGTKDEYESESNFLNLCRRPAALVRMHSSN